MKAEIDKLNEQIGLLDRLIAVTRIASKAGDGDMMIFAGGLMKELSARRLDLVQRQQAELRLVEQKVEVAA